MAEEPESLLHALRADVGDLKADTAEIKTRLGHMEGLYANLSGRVDRLASDVALIKRRLDLVEV